MASSTNRQSKAQRETGLDHTPYKKYLSITLETAKQLVHGKDHRVWGWAQIELPAQEKALDDVTGLLDKQGIRVRRDVIETRLQNAIKDLKAKASKTSQSASSSTSEVEHKQSYDPIRDI